MATNDIGRVTPIWRGFFSAATTYELNDIVIDTAGSVWWHKSEAITTGVAPGSGEVWDAVIDMSIFSGLIQAAITTAQTALAAAQEAVAEVTADTERAETAADNAENSAAAASESAAGVGALAQAAERSAEAAAGSATGAAGSAQAAAGSKSDAEAYAVGKRGGEDVGSTDPTYHNNAKYYAEQAASEAEAAAQSAEDAQDVLDSIPEDYSQLSADVGDLKTQLSYTSIWGSKETNNTLLALISEIRVYGADPSKSYGFPSVQINVANGTADISMYEVSGSGWGSGRISRYIKASGFTKNNNIVVLTPANNSGVTVELHLNLQDDTVVSVSGLTVAKCIINKKCYEENSPYKIVSDINALETSFNNVAENHTGINIMDVSMIEKGDINYNTGVDSGTSINIRTKNYFECANGDKFSVALFSGVSTACYVIFYKADKSYDSYQYVSLGKVYGSFTVSSATAAYFRIKFVANSVTEDDVLNSKPVLVNGETVPVEYIAYNQFGGYAVSGCDEYSKLGKQIFTHGRSTDFTRIMSNAIKEAYFPNTSYIGKLKLTSFSKKTSAYAYDIRCSTVEGGVSTRRYRGVAVASDTTAITGDFQLVKLAADDGTLPGYMLINFGGISDNYNSNQTDDSVLFNDCVFDLAKMPELLSGFTLSSPGLFTANENKTLTIDSLVSGESGSNVFTLLRNADVPLDKESIHIIAGVDGITELPNGTDAQIIASLMPYLFFSGYKIGCFVMYDGDNRAYIITKDGTKKYLTLED